MGADGSAWICHKARYMSLVEKDIAPQRLRH
jgi:hypothetical protein